MREIVLFFVIVLFGSFSFPTMELNTEHIEWITFEEAIKRNEKKPKKLLIDLYTDWCGWCKKMDKDTYENSKIAAYVNKHYYAVKFNAEQKEDVQYDGHTFKYINLFLTSTT